MRRPEIPSIPFSELIPKQQEVLGIFISLNNARRRSMQAAGIEGTTIEVNRFPGGGVRITWDNKRVSQEIQIGGSPFRKVDLDR